MPASLPSDALVLVTAASSYTGAHIALACLADGFRVRAAVRSQGRLDALQHQLKDAPGADRLEYTLVPDGARPSAYLAACRNVAAIVHVAAPLPFPCEDVAATILQKGVDMNTSLLESALATPSVQRVVLTGSADSVFDWDQGLHRPHTYEGSEWTPSTWDQAREGKTFLDILPAAKKYAEQAAWEWVRARSPHFDLVSVLPTVTLGPYAGAIHSVREIGGSAYFVVYQALKSKRDADVGPVIIPHAVDVRDVATAHARALRSGIAGQRYLVSSRCFDHDEVLHILSDSDLLQRKIEVANVPPATKGYFQVDTEPSRRDLGLIYRPLHDTIVDTARQFEALE
ncbi:unnamed protein product [Parajaminaea phylloscopi]